MARGTVIAIAPSVILALLLVACSTDPVTTDGGSSTRDGSPGVDAPARDAGAPRDSAFPRHDAQLPDAPDWVNDLEPGVWAPISMNTLADVDPADDPAINPNHPLSPPWRGNEGQPAVLDDWNGGAFVPTLGALGSLVVWGGGHQGYYGNELYAFDLGERRWRRLTDPYAEPIEFPYEDGFYPDGTPVPPHTYDQIEFHPPTSSFVTLRTMQHNAPDNVPVAAMFSFDAMSWRRSPRNEESHHNSGGWSAYDAARDVIWAEGGSGTSAFTRFEPNVDNGDGTFGRWTNYDEKIFTTSAVAALDPIRDILVVSTFVSDTNMYAIDLTTPEEDAVVLMQAGDAPPPDGGHGWEWSVRLGAFVYWSDGPDVFALEPPADWRTGAFSWRRLSTGTSTVAPAAPGNPVYSRFRLVEFPGVSIALIVTEVDGPVFAFRLPG